MSIRMHGFATPQAASHEQSRAREGAVLSGSDRVSYEGSKALSTLNRTLAGAALLRQLFG